MFKRYSIQKVSSQHATCFDLYYHQQTFNIVVGWKVLCCKKRHRLRELLEIEPLQLIMKFVDFYGT
jgi:hypothetical protein